MRIAYIYSNLVYNLSPELELFKKAIDSYSTIEDPSFDLSCEGEIDRLIAQKKDIDFLCIENELYNILEDETPYESASNLYNRCENEIPSKNILEGCTTISKSKKKLNNLIESPSITSILYMAIIDPWRMTGKDYERSMEALVKKDMYIYNYEEQFMPNIPCPYYYTSLIRESSERNRFIPLRHSLDPSYDVKYTDIDKELLINCMPSFKNNRLAIIRKLEGHMCDESRKLLKDSFKSIQELKKIITKIKIEVKTKKIMSQELLTKAIQARDIARHNYQLILSKSKYIFTEAVNYSMVRKFIELPYSGSILCSNENGWERNILLNREYPMFNTQKNTFNKDKMKKAYETYQSSNLLGSISSNILESYSYEKRLKRLEMFFY